MMRYSILIMIFLFIIPNAASIGIRPHETVIDFRPNLEYNGTFKIVNDENLTREIKLLPQGSFSGIIKLQNDTIMQKSGTEMNVVRFSVLLPETMDEGTHETSIKIMPQDRNATGIGVSLIMNHAVKINVLPEYSRLLIDFLYDNQTLKIRLKNPRNEAIQNLKITLSIMDGKKTTESITFKAMSMAALELKEIEQKNIKLKPGIYNIQYEVKSGNFNFSNSKELTAGKKEILFNPATNNLLPNRINRIPAIIENKWNKQSTAAVEMSLLNKTSILSSYKTKELNLMPYEKRNIELYLESQDIPAGNYTLRFLIRYDKAAIRNEIPIELSLQASASQKIQILPMIIGAVIVIILVMLLLYLKRGNK